MFFQISTFPKIAKKIKAKQSIMLFYSYLICYFRFVIGDLYWKDNLKISCRCEEGALPDTIPNALIGTKQSPVQWEIASGKEQKRPRNDMDVRGVF
jgi:hypothetical protein